MKRIKIIIFFVLTCSFNFISQPILYENFPIIYDIDAYRSNTISSTMAADFNNDGRKEIVVSSHKNLTSRIFMYNHYGDLLPGFPFVIAGQNKWNAAGDIDKDGKIDYIFILHSLQGDSIIAINHLAKRISGLSVGFGINQYEQIALYDLESDGNLDIIVTADHKLIVYNNDGTIKQGWPVQIDNFFTGYLSIGDIDNDNKAEIVIPSGCYQFGNFDCDSNKINIYRYNGTIYNGFPIVSDSLYLLRYKAVVISKLNNEPVLISSSAKVIDLYTDVRDRITIMNASGQILKRFYYQTTHYTYTPVVADINNDSIPEILTGNTDTEIIAFDINGSILPGWPKPGHNSVNNQITIGKLTNEITICSPTGVSIGNKGFIYMYFSNGNALSWSPLRPDGIVVNGLMIFDINNDGYTDILTESMIINNSIYSQCISLWKMSGITYNIKDVPWPMWGHDRYRSYNTTFIPPDEVIGIKPVSTEIPDKFILHQNYPNPFNPGTTIRFDLPAKTQTKLEIIDITGRIVKTLVNEELQSGVYSLNFDSGNLSSGIYFYRIITDKFTETKKMVLIK